MVGIEVKTLKYEIVIQTDFTWLSKLPAKLSSLLCSTYITIFNLKKYVPDEYFEAVFIIAFIAVQKWAILIKM